MSYCSSQKSSPTNAPQPILTKSADPSTYPSQHSTSPPTASQSLPTAYPEQLISILPNPPSPDFDVVLKTSDGVGFLAHESILRLASTSPEGIFSQWEASQLSYKQSNVDDTSYELVQRRAISDPRADLRVYNVPAPYSAIDALLRLLYPSACSPAFAGPDAPLDGSIKDAFLVLKNIGPVFIIAQKFRMPGVVADLCMRILDVANSPSFNEDSPLALRVYATACRFQLAGAAQGAAYACLRGRGLGLYTSELENVRGDSYFKLIDYRRRAIEAVLIVLAEYDLVQISPSFESFKASLITCTNCFDDTRKYALCSTHRPRTAAWWDTFSGLATEILRVAPRSKKIYSIELLSQVSNKANDCEVCSKTILTRWMGVERALKYDIEKAIASVKLDLSCLNK